ncbi:MAG: exo-alpha-sialidase, partial [Gemmatimonadota bacterium]
MIRRIMVLLAVLVVASNTALVAQLSQPLDSATMAGFKWRSVGPTNMGGRITDVEGLPSPSKTFYVAAAAGGIWKTTNNGISFQQLWTESRVVSMGDIAIAPSNPDILWAGTGEEDSRNSISPGGGVFKSTDGGMTWELKGLVETQVIGRIRVHPTNPDIVFVAAVGHIWDSNPERGLYRTQDGGETWELVKFISDKAGFVDVIMDPRDPNVLFASSWERVRGPWFLNSGGPGSALWKSTDGGDSWTEVVGNGFPTANKGRIGLDISLSNPDVMYAMVEAEDEDSTTGNGLYRSEDGGVNWEKVNDANSRPFYYSQVRVDPQDPDRVYFSSTPVQFSDDGGKTAGTTTNGIHVDHHAMWIDPNDPDRIVVGNDGGVAISFDKGGNWAYLNNMALGQFYHVSYNMDVPYRVCGGLQDNGTWCSPSRLARGQRRR